MSKQFSSVELYGRSNFDANQLANQLGYWDVTPSHTDGGGDSYKFISYNDPSFKWNMLGADEAAMDAKKVWGKQLPGKADYYGQDPQAYQVAQFNNASYSPWDMGTYKNLWSGDQFFNKDFAQRIADNLGQLNVNELPVEVRQRMGLDPNDNAETSVVFTDPTKPFWGAQTYKKGGGFADWWSGKGDGMGQNLATIAATVAAAYGAGAALGAGAGAEGAGAGAGVGGAEGAAGAIPEISSSLPAMEAIPDFGAVVSPYAGAEGAAAGAGAGGWTIETPTSLGEVGNSVGYTDALTGGAGAGNLTNAGGGFNGLVNAGMGTGASGYPAIDALAGAGTPPLSSSLGRQLVDQLKDKLKDPNTIKDLLGTVTGTKPTGTGQNATAGQNLALLMQNPQVTLPNRSPSTEEIAALLGSRGGEQPAAQSTPIGVNLVV